MTRAPALDANPFPIAVAASVFLLAVGGLAFMRPDELGPAAQTAFGAIGPAALLVGLVPLVAAALWWTRRAIAGQAEPDAARSLRAERVGMVLFLVSEAAFFAALFAAYLHFALDPGIAGLSAWPPAAIRPVDPWGGPLLNTAILLASGVAAAAAHDRFLRGGRRWAALGLAVAIALGLAFLGLQAREFLLATFGYRDGVYPSVFFLATGFHGLHVLIGVCLLAVCLARLLTPAFAPRGSFGFDAAVWYWHFVDAVWLLLFAVFYAWGG